MQYHPGHPLRRIGREVLLVLGLEDGLVYPSVIPEPADQEKLHQLPEECGQRLQDFLEKNFHFGGPFLADQGGGQGNQPGDLEEKRA